MALVLLDRVSSLNMANNNPYAKALAMVAVLRFVSSMSFLSEGANVWLREGLKRSGLTTCEGVRAKRV